MLAWVPCTNMIEGSPSSSLLACMTLSLRRIKSCQNFNFFINRRHISYSKAVLLLKWSVPSAKVKFLIWLHTLSHSFSEQFRLNKKLNWCTVWEGLWFDEFVEQLALCVCSSLIFFDLMGATLSVTLAHKLTIISWWANWPSKHQETSLMLIQRRERKTVHHFISQLISCASMAIGV